MASSKTPEEKNKLIALIDKMIAERQKICDDMVEKAIEECDRPPGSLWPASTIRDAAKAAISRLEEIKSALK